MGLIETFEKKTDRASGEEKDKVAIKLVTAKAVEEEELVSFFDKFYPDIESRTAFLKKYFVKIYPIYPVKVLSSVFGVSIEALRARAYRRGVTKEAAWTPEEDEYLLKNYKIKRNKELQKELGKTKWAIINRWVYLNKDS